MRPRLSHLALIAALAGALSAAPRAAHAAHADPRERADALFDSGKRLLTAGETAAACRALAESQRLVPRPGTLLNLALCHEAEGRTATAAAELAQVEALSRAPGAPNPGLAEQRAALARRHIEALAPSLDHLVVRVDGGVETAGLLVTLDGAALDRGRWGASIPVDPGDHTIEAAGPVCPPWRTIVRFGPRGETRVVVVPAPDAAASDGQAKRIAGLTLGGAALVAVGAGAFFGVRALVLAHDGAARCAEGASGCDGGSRSTYASARLSSRIAGAAAGVGLALGGAAIYLVVSSTPAPAKAPLRVQARLLPSGAALLVEGDL